MAVDWPDSAITRCNQLIPATTGFSERPASQAVWLQVTSDELIVDLAEGDLALGLDIANMQGQLVLHVDQQALAVNPIRVPTASLASGSYVCSVQLASRTISSTFTIAR
jgi:hypothetical protein